MKPEKIRFYRNKLNIHLYISCKKWKYFKNMLAILCIKLYNYHSFERAPVKGCEIVYFL